MISYYGRVFRNIYSGNLYCISTYLKNNNIFLKNPLLGMCYDVSKHQTLSILTPYSHSSLHFVDVITLCQTVTTYVVAAGQFRDSTQTLERTVVIIIGRSSFPQIYLGFHSRAATYNVHTDYYIFCTLLSGYIFFDHYGIKGSQVREGTAQVRSL